MLTFLFALHLILLLNGSRHGVQRSTLNASKPGPRERTSRGLEVWRRMASDALSCSSLHASVNSCRII
jgi:hypothetical protein